MPQGEVYDFLKSAGVVAGSGPELLVDLLGPISWMSYILVATSNPADAKGLEEFSFDGLAIMIFALMPVTVADKTTYTPVQTGA